VPLEQVASLVLEQVHVSPSPDPRDLGVVVGTNRAQDPIRATTTPRSAGWGAQIGLDAQIAD
jgi:hypothetical protein